MNDTGVFLAPLMTVNNVGMAWHEPGNQRRHDFMDCRSGLIFLKQWTVIHGETR